MRGNFNGKNRANMHNCIRLWSWYPWFSWFEGLAVKQDYSRQGQETKEERKVCVFWYYISLFWEMAEGNY